MMLFISNHIVAHKHSKDEYALLHGKRKRAGIRTQKAWRRPKEDLLHMAWSPNAEWLCCGGTSGSANILPVANRAGRKIEVFWCLQRRLWRTCGLKKGDCFYFLSLSTASCWAALLLSSSAARFLLLSSWAAGGKMIAMSNRFLPFIDVVRNEIRFLPDIDGTADPKLVPPCSTRRLMAGFVVVVESDEGPFFW